ncbi:hypothetical protein EXIGLDRAFT_694341 [Exidia glandulosa HHB12029]|uniref:Ricin B lectin domain-containing protein n=1 Tax=Exidia glandulosa HHB12029 TaxID=1314781 RepID=A0A165NMN2_EXIGL|nr:hypothetical protein EXIGLDRAFT_694341 [Exidia glandulosa HHB12029]
MFASLFTLVLAVSAAVAGTPTEELVARASTTPDCTTKFAGILSTNATTRKSFTLNSAGQVAYLGTGTSPLVVQFQQCTSLQKTNQIPNTSNGRLFVPSQGKCIGTTNSGNAAAPYYTTLVKCGNGVSQRFRLNNQTNAIYWYPYVPIQYGRSADDGTFFQGGCGQLGYKSNNVGTPVITHTGEQITLECSSKSAFFLSNKAA